jgi:hypothetical protein
MHEDVIGREFLEEEGSVECGVWRGDVDDETLYRASWFETV